MFIGLLYKTDVLHLNLVIIIQVTEQQHDPVRN